MRRAAVIMMVGLVATCVACSGNGLADQGLKGPTTTTGRRAATSTTTSTVPPASTTTTTPAGPPAATGFPDGWMPAPLQWATCKSHAGFQCATLIVPLDWSQPNGTQISLALARQQATGSRIGALVANPGGPGASGIDFLFDQPFKPALRQRFDLVSWDPRGVGQSTHLTCGSTVKPFLHLDPSPDTPAEQQAIDAAAQAIANQCAQEDANLLSHLGTDDTARDLEAIRLAVGDPKLTYYGFSYGTYIGERYLALFPTHVRALVLDGVVNPTEDLTALLKGQTVAMTAAIGRAFASCKKQTSCQLSNPQASYDKVRDEVETKPLPTGTARPLGPAELATGAIYATYDPQLWSSLNVAVAQAASGDGSDMSQLADGYYDIGDWTAYADITCVDMNHPVGAAAYQAFVDSLNQISPDFGGSIGNEMLPCAFWPTPPQPHTDPIPAPQSPDILVVGNTGDAATPYQDAQYVASMLAHGHLVTYHGQGHTSYGRDDCIDAVIHDYLINLKVPPTDPQCAGAGSIPAP